MGSSHNGQAGQRETKILVLIQQDQREQTGQQSSVRMIMGHTVNAQKQGLRPDRGILQYEHISQEAERGVSSAWWYDNGWCATQCVPRQPVPCMCVGPILHMDTKTRLWIQKLIESDLSRV